MRRLVIGEFNRCCPWHKACGDLRSIVFEGGPNPSRPLLLPTVVLALHHPHDPHSPLACTLMAVSHHLSAVDKANEALQIAIDALNAD